MLTFLNSLSGLFSLLALVAAVTVPIILYRKKRKDERKARQNELEAMNDVSRFPMSDSERNHYTKKTFLEKEIRR